MSLSNLFLHGNGHLGLRDGEESVDLGRTPDQILEILGFMESYPHAVFTEHYPDGACHLRISGKAVNYLGPFYFGTNRARIEEFVQQLPAREEGAAQLVSSEDEEPSPFIGEEPLRSEGGGFVVEKADPFENDRSDLEEHVHVRVVEGKGSIYSEGDGFIVFIAGPEGDTERDRRFIFSRSDAHVLEDEITGNRKFSSHNATGIQFADMGVRKAVVELRPLRESTLRVDRKGFLDLLSMTREGRKAGPIQLV